MKRKLPVTAIIFLIQFTAFAIPPATTPHIKIDQFGYLPNSKKVAIIVDPQTGYNAAESFSPGTGANQYQVRRWTDDAVVF
jgi:endoglucanase